MNRPLGPRIGRLAGHWILCIGVTSYGMHGWNGFELCTVFDIDGFDLAGHFGSAADQ